MGASESPRTLVLLNGPPASGKSTLARRWSACEDRLETVDIDTIRAQLVLWPSDPEAAGVEARRLALSRIADLLVDARDVVVAQHLRRPTFVDALADLADTLDVSFIECALQLDRSSAIEAFLERSATSGDTEHRDAEVLVPTVRRAEHLADMYDEFTAFCRDRPGIRVVPVTRGDVGATLARLRAVVPEV